MANLWKLNHGSIHLHISKRCIFLNWSFGVFGMTALIIIGLQAVVIGYLARKLYQARKKLNEMESADYERRLFGC